MKKIFTLALALVFGLNAMAQQKSNVVVFSEDGDTFFAFLNGIKQNATAQSNVKITDIPGQNASLRLVFANSSDQPLKQDLYFMEPNQEHTIKIKRDKKGNLKARYFGAVPLSESASVAATVPYTTTEATTTNNNSTVNTTNTYNTTGTVDNANVNMNMQVNDPNMNGTTTTSQTVTTTTTNGTNNAGINMNVGVGETGFNMNVNVSGTGDPYNNNSGTVNMNVGLNGMEGMNTSTTTTTTTTTTSSSTTVNGYTTGSSSTTTTNGGYTNNTANTSGQTYADVPANCPYEMNYIDFNKMKEAVADNSFEETRLSTAKTATKGSCLSTDQVKQIMELFSFEDSKLEYAKFAYDYTVDKNNFYTLGKVFTYSSSKEDLNNFIEKKR